MQKSFWENKPVNVISDHQNKSILKTSDLLHLIQLDNNHFKIKLSSKVLRGSLSYEKKCEIVTFINKSYSSKGTSLTYSLDILDYFLTQDTLVIEFTPVNSDVQIGLIIGKRQDLIISGKLVNSFEVNFLCLAEKLRNLHVSSVMINMLTTEVIQRYDIEFAHYTIGKNIKIPAFCTKRMFHRPININHLAHCGFFGDKVDVIDYITTFNQFNNKNYNDLIYLNAEQPRNYQEIFEKLQTYRNERYEIHDVIHEHDFQKTFKNKSFHHFVFIKNESVYAYFTIFNLPNVNNNTKMMYKNGILYRHFCKDNDLSKLLESVSQKCYELGILDTLTLTENSEFQVRNWLLGSGFLNYYMFNRTLPLIKPHLNGMVTI